MYTYAKRSQTHVKDSEVHVGVRWVRETPKIIVNDRRIGRMFPEHVERRFLDREYSFEKYQLALPNTSN